MKTYYFIISEQFPRTHKRLSEETKFKQKIIDKIKLHTIRGNYEFWKKRFDEINKGNAFLSIRGWVGKPYRSKQKEYFRFYKEDGIGIEKLEFKPIHSACAATLTTGKLNFLGYQPSVNIESLAKNDGLSLDDFKEWFYGYDFTKPMAIIHLTTFRYYK